MLSRSESNPAAPLEQRQVTQVFIHTVGALRILEIQGDDGNVETIRTTDVHPFFAEGRGWIKASELEVGDRVQETDGTWQSVLSTVSESHPDGFTVYNLEVGGDHTYFIEDGFGAADAVWVHNADVCGSLGPTEKFTSPADAIGDLQGTATKVGSGITKDATWKDWGYTVTNYYRDSNGTKWTVFFNPKLKVLSGAHMSSGQ